MSVKDHTENIRLKNGAFLPLMRTSHRGEGFLIPMSHKTKEDAPSARLSARINDFLKRSQEKSQRQFQNSHWRASSSQSISSSNISLSDSTDSLASLGQSETGGFSLVDEEDLGVVDGGSSFASAQDSSAASQKSGNVNRLEGCEGQQVNKGSGKEIEFMKMRATARESYYSDKIMLMRKTLEKQCSEAYESADDLRQLVAKMQHEVRNLSDDNTELKLRLQNEKTQSYKLEERIRKECQERELGIGQIQLKNLIIQELNREKSEVGQQAEWLRTELHRIKLELYLKEGRVEGLLKEIAENKLLHSDKVAETISNFHSKLSKLEEEHSFLQDELDGEKRSKKRLQEEIEESRRIHKMDAETHNDQLKSLHDSYDAKIGGLEIQLVKTEKEKAELLKSKRELEAKIVEMEVVEELGDAQSQATVETIKASKAEISRLQILLTDYQLMAESTQKTDADNKAIIRQLKTSLEVLDSEKCQLGRLRAKAEEEVRDALNHLADVTRSENETQKLNRKLAHENVRLEQAVEELNKELENALKNYRLTLEDAATEKSNLADQLTINKGLSEENGILKEKMAALTKRLEILEQGKEERENLSKKMLHLKLGEYKSKIKMEEIRQRRTEDQLEKCKSELSLAQGELHRLRIDSKTALQLLHLKEKESREAVQGKKSLAYKVDALKAQNAKLGKLYQISNIESDSLRGELKSSIQRINAVRDGMSLSQDNCPCATPSLE